MSDLLGNVENPDPLAALTDVPDPNLVTAVRDVEYPDPLAALVSLGSILVVVSFTFVLIILAPFLLPRVGRWSLITMLKLCSKWYDVPVKHKFTKSELKSLYWIYFWFILLVPMIFYQLFDNWTSVSMMIALPVVLWIASTFNWVKLDITSNDSQKQAIFTVASVLSVILGQLVLVSLFVVYLVFIAVIGWFADTNFQHMYRLG